jgi:2-haloacid dehalogenase
VCFDGIGEHFPVLDRFDGVLISGEVGTCKPDPAIYRHCEDRFGFTAADAVFLDDNADNVAGAIAAGWDAFVFTEAAPARAELAARGLFDWG